MVLIQKQPKAQTKTLATTDLSTAGLLDHPINVQTECLEQATDTAGDSSQHFEVRCTDCVLPQCRAVLVMLPQYRAALIVCYHSVGLY